MGGRHDLGFAKWEKTLYHNQDETPYSETGRQIHFDRTKKKRQNARLDELSIGPENTVVLGRVDPKNNFEYYMNRAYALNRDRLKCPDLRSVADRQNAVYAKDQSFSSPERCKPRQ